VLEWRRFPRFARVTRPRILVILTISIQQNFYSQNGKRIEILWHRRLLTLNWGVQEVCGRPEGVYLWLSHEKYTRWGRFSSVSFYTWALYIYTNVHTLRLISSGVYLPSLSLHSSTPYLSVLTPPSYIRAHVLIHTSRLYQIKINMIKISKWIHTQNIKHDNNNNINDHNISKTLFRLVRLWPIDIPTPLICGFLSMPVEDFQKWVHGVPRDMCVLILW